MDTMDGTRTPGTCLRVKYFPAEWATTDQDIDEKIACIITKATKADVSTVRTSHSYTLVTADSEQKYSYAYVTFTSCTQVCKLIDNIQEVAIQGKNLKAALCAVEVDQVTSAGDHDADDESKDNTWVHLQRHDAQDPYGPQDNQDPHRKKPDNVDVEPATMMQPDLDHDTLQPWTPRCALDGPKWNDHDLFQAILLRGQKVLLTTYSQNRGEYLDPIDELQTPVGTMWDYTSKYRRQQWIATSQREHPALVMEKIQGMHTMKWMGKNCRVADPDKIHFPRVSALCHKSFIHTHKKQNLTCIAPPIWVWSDRRMLAGAWCIVATTIKMNIAKPEDTGDVIHTGLVLISTLTCSGSW